MFDDDLVEADDLAGVPVDLPRPGEAPREPALDLACAPGPLALLLAGSLDSARLSDEAELDLIGLMERSITVAQSLRSVLIADYADRLATDHPASFEEQREMDWHREQLAAVCRTSPHEADVRCRTAQALRDRLPVTAAAVRSGDLPWAQAVVLARESAGLDDAASSAVERAVLSDPRARSVRQVRDATRTAVEKVRPAAADERVRDAHATRTLEFWPHDDGSTDLFARLATDAAITVAAALEPLAVRGGPDDERTAEQRRADALVALALGDMPPARATASGRRPSADAGSRNSAERDPGDTPRAYPAGSPGQIARPPVNLTLLAHDDPSRPLYGGLTGGLLAGGHLGNTPIPPETLRRVTCEATVAVAVVTPDGALGPESGRRRFPDAALRRRLEARDQHCSFPGCPVSARRCHAHHIRHWSNGGPTTPENMVLACHRHHNAVHEGGWTLDGTATRLRWRDPHGRVYSAPVAAATVPPWSTDPPLADLATLDPPDPDPPDPDPPDPDPPDTDPPGTDPPSTGGRDGAGSETGLAAARPVPCG